MSAEGWGFLVITLAFGGGCAWLTGRAVAATWRPFIQAIGYALLLAMGTRFLLYALAEVPLFSLAGYLRDAAIMVAVAALAWRVTRVRRMLRQYPWLYERAGLLGWRERRQP